MNRQPMEKAKQIKLIAALLASLSLLGAGCNSSDTGTSAMAPAHPANADIAAVSETNARSLSSDSGAVTEVSLDKSGEKHSGDEKREDRECDDSVHHVHGLGCLLGWLLGLGHEHDHRGRCHRPPQPDCTPSPTATPSSLPSATSLPSNCFEQRIAQPSLPAIKSVDILFITDTSGSLSEERGAIAEKIDDFVRELPREVDYQIGVMLGHGSRSSLSGRLYSYKYNRPVLSSRTMSLSTIRSQLRQNLANAPYDRFSDGGEEGLYVLARAMDKGPLTDARAKGFFRTNAALSVIFISDENDICAVYPAGVTRAPDLDGNLEENARKRDCSGITPESVHAKVKAMMGDRPFVISGILHTDRNYQREDRSEDEYGWGYMELIGLSGGKSVDIGEPDYAASLRELGVLTASKLQLLTRFPLRNSPVEPASVEVRVDGANVAFTYDTVKNEVSIDSSVAGRANSIVDVNYCLKGADPQPSPTPTPTETSSPEPEPTPTPTETLSPEPEPTPTPTETLSPEPEPTPTPTETSSPEPEPTPTPTETSSPEPTPTPTPTSTVTPDPEPSPTETPPACEGPGCDGGFIGV